MFELNVTDPHIGPHICTCANKFQSEKIQQTATNI